MTACPEGCEEETTKEAVMESIATSGSELEIAIAVVEESMALAEEVRTSMVTQALEKADRSPVTIADFAIQALVSHRLKKAFPDLALVAEESAQALRVQGESGLTAKIVDYLSKREPKASAEKVWDWIDRGAGEAKGRYWVLDPVDGTKGFLRDAQYVVALALIKEGRVEVAVLGCPRLRLENGSAPGAVVFAVRGKGAWVKDRMQSEVKRLEVSDCSDFAGARVLRSFESGHTDAEKMRLLMDEMAVERDPVLMDSQAKYALIAAGKGDLLLRLPSPLAKGYREKIWDHASGLLVVEEAGGLVSDIHGAPLDFTCGRTLERNTGVVVSNGRLHKSTLEALRRLE